MKILVDGMPKRLGGIGTLILNITDFNNCYIDDKKIEFYFLTPKDSKYNAVLKEKGYMFFEVPRIIEFDYVKELVKIFHSNKFDYIWINNSSKINVILPIISKICGVKVIAHSHGTASEYVGIKKVLLEHVEKLLSRLYVALIDVPLACSSDSAKYFYPQDMLTQCVVVPNGIYTEHFLFNDQMRNSIRDSYNISCSDILIGAVGRISHVKNYSFLIEVLNQLPANYKLMIIGDGEETEKINGLIDDYCLGERVFVLGSVSNVNDYLNAMDIFAMPSLHEGMPFSLIEAQVNGLYCIVSDGISYEAKLIDEVHYVKLLEKEWVNAIIDYTANNDKRIRMSEMAASSKFNIRNSFEIFVNAIGGYNDNKT